MSRKLPPLNSLRTFESAARHLSFTKASEELFVTQAAVSHQIKHLEDFLGTSLFHRKNRKLSLTEEGADYWPEIRDIFEHLSDATSNLQSEGLSGALAVDVTPTFAIEWLIPRLDLFNELYPDIDVRISANNSHKEVDFFGGDVDIAIYFSKGRYRKGIYKETLLNEYLIPVCSPKIFNDDRPLDLPSDLQKFRLIHNSTTEDWIRWLDKVDIEGIDVNRGTIFSHAVMVLQAAVHGQGVALGYSILSKQLIDIGQLVCPFDITLPSINSFDFVCPEGHQDKPKIAAFRDWLKTMIEDYSADDPFRLDGQYIET
ncbi:MAG: transcriptional regulator GcvA [Gammaproteobacteria bacterium]|nr:transcriptional regulator GcvA [Gammaproteobacteria bacterium]